MAECGFAEVSCKVGEAMGGIEDGLTADIKEAVEMFVEATFTGWLHMPVPLIGEGTGAVGFLRDNTMPLVGILLGIAVVIFAGKLIFKPTAETFANGAKFGMRTIVVLGGSIVIGGMLIQTADGYSTWIIDKATEGDGLGTTLLNTFQVTGPAGFFVALIFGIVAIFCSIIQGLLLAARNVMLPLLIALAPVVASVSNSDVGSSWWTKYLSWFTAFLLYKPTAATIYAAGFYLLGKGDILGSQTLGETVVAGMNFIYGIMLLALSIFAFSALMSVITPVTGKLAGGMAGAGAIVTSAAALGASGAIGTAMSAAASGSTSAVSSIAPVNAAAGGPGAASSVPGPSGPGGSGPSGAQGNPSSPGPSGTDGTPGAPSAPSAPAGDSGKIPGESGIKFTTDAMSHAQHGLSDSLNNDKDEN